MGPSLKRLPIAAVKNASTQSVTGMGEVIHVSLGEVHYSTSVQGVLSKRIQAKLDQQEERLKKLEALLVGSASKLPEAP